MESPAYAAAVRALKRLSLRELTHLTMNGDLRAIKAEVALRDPAEQEKRLQESRPHKEK